MTFKNYWKWIIVALVIFIVIFHLGAIVYLSNQQTYELTSPDYYQRGQAYEQEIQAMNRGREFNTEVTVEQQNQLVVTVKPVEAELLDSSVKEVRLDCLRPNDSKMDQNLILARQVDSNSFSAPMTLSKGRWHIDISFTLNGERILFKKTLVF
ncbi:MAG: hypothetical protein CR997_02075 [Acidobacteria bacterium]|nr:MAG: hypothetical protein CR997_02075 [Acidobacteriota bacterium]